MSSAADQQPSTSGVLATDRAGVPTLPANVDAWGEMWLVGTGTLITVLVAEVLIRRRTARRRIAAPAQVALVS